MVAMMTVCDTRTRYICLLFHLFAAISPVVLKRVRIHMVATSMKW
jgi:hypothetical protein